MERFFLDYDGGLRLWVWMVLLVVFCIIMPSSCTYYFEKYECVTVYAEQTGRNTQWRYGSCWVEMNGKFIPQNEIRMTETK